MKASRDAKTDQMDALDEEILRYVLGHPGATAQSMLRDVLEDETQRRSALYRRLEGLRTRGYLAQRPLSPERGAASPQQYFVHARGAHAIGERMPRDHARHRRRDFRLLELIKQQLRAQAEQAGHYLLEENADARTILASVAKQQALQQYGSVQPDHVYLRLVPQTITPDLVLYSPQATTIVILSHPHAGRAAFKARIKKYEPLLSCVRIRCYTLSDEQRQQWQETLRTYDHYHQTDYAARFDVIGLDAVDLAL